MGVDLQKLEVIYYLSMHVAAQKIFQIDQFPLKDKLLLRKAEDGPFKYYSQNDWKTDQAVDAACKDISLRTNIMKIIGTLRTYINENIDGKLSNDICHWID